MSILAAEGMTPSLDAGSALGAHRHHGIIPLSHEKDIDVALLDWEDHYPSNGTQVRLEKAIKRIREVTGATLYQTDGMENSWENWGVLPDGLTSNLYGVQRSAYSLLVPPQLGSTYFSRHCSPGDSACMKRNIPRVELWLYSKTMFLHTGEPGTTCRIEGSPPDTVCYNERAFVSSTGVDRVHNVAVFEGYVLPSVNAHEIDLDPQNIMGSANFRTDCYDKPCSMYYSQYRFVDFCSGVEVMRDQGKFVYAVHRINDTCISIKPAICDA